jgi:hypothetical protein
LYRDMNLFFKNSRLLIGNNKLLQNCCRWKVVGYTTEIIGTPACVTNPILELSPYAFTGTPTVAARAAITGFLDVVCPNIPLGPCRSTVLQWTDGELVSTTCQGTDRAFVRFEFEDCPNAYVEGDGFPLLSKDLAVIVEVVAA